MIRVSLATIAILVCGSQLQAQNSAAAGSEAMSLLMQQVKDLQQQTIELQQKVKAIEAERARALPIATSAAITTEQPTPAPTSALPSPEEAPALHELQGIQWRGFGEADYRVLDQRKAELGTGGFDPGSAGNFFTGGFDLFLSSQLSDRASVLGEIVFQETNGQSYTVDLRRMLLKYDFNDHLRMSFGRYQTGIGYYNWAFRSAAWLQTTADRPLIMEYASNGGLLPTQAVGVSVTGLIPSGKLLSNLCRRIRLQQYGSPRYQRFRSVEL